MRKDEEEEEEGRLRQVREARRVEKKQVEISLYSRVCEGGREV